MSSNTFALTTVHGTVGAATTKRHPLAGASLSGDRSAALVHAGVDLGGRRARADLVDPVVMAQVSLGGAAKPRTAAASPLTTMPAILRNLVAVAGVLAEEMTWTRARARRRTARRRHPAPPAGRGL
jgi:hypothetical protein